jgi:hypothetical protein
LPAERALLTQLAATRFENNREGLANALLNGLSAGGGPACTQARFGASTTGRQRWLFDRKRMLRSLSGSTVIGCAAARRVGDESTALCAHGSFVLFARPVSRRSTFSDPANTGDLFPATIRPSSAGCISHVSAAFALNGPFVSFAWPLFGDRSGANAFETRELLFARDGRPAWRFGTGGVGDKPTAFALNDCLVSLARPLLLNGPGPHSFEAGELVLAAILRRRRSFSRTAGFLSLQTCFSDSTAFQMIVRG